MLKLLFVADPMETMNVDRDTTFAMMLEAQRRGHACYEAWIEHLSSRRGLPYTRANVVKVQRTTQGQHFTRGVWESFPLAHFDAIIMRKDPPVDDAYVTSLQLLDQVDRKGTQVLNDPRGILAANEKLYALQFREHIPETIVTRSFDDVVAFFKEVNEDMILKPLDGHGGEGVLRVVKGDRNLRSMVEVLTHMGKTWVMCQRYLKEAREGDKRILLVDGHAVGAILRVPADDDNRGNIHVGARVHKTTPTPRELAICESIAPTLRRDGLTFVGIDVIGERLTEVNVTSPTGAQEIGRNDGTCPEGALIDVVEKRATR